MNDRVGMIIIINEQSKEIDRLREQVKVLRAACQAGIDAFGSITNHYGTGLQVINWHLNGGLEPFDNFIDYSRADCASGSLSKALEQTKPKEGE